MEAKLIKKNQTDKKNVQKNENKSLIINDLNPCIYVNIYGDRRLDFPVCIVKGLSPKIIEKTTFRAFLEKVKTGDLKEIETANNLKTAYQSENKKAYNEIKQNLNGFVIGDFKSRKDAECIVYVPLLAIDIDGYTDSLEMSWDLEHLKTNPFVFGAFPSPSCHGLRVLVWCDTSFENHKDTYTSLVQYFAEWLNMTTDKEKFPHLDISTSNPSRLWFYTATKDVFINIESQVFTPSVVKPLDDKKEKKTATKQKTTLYTNALSDTEKIEICTQMVKERNALIDGRNNFIYRLACLSIEHGVMSDVILSYCLTHFVTDDFNKAEIQKTVASAAKRVTFGKFTESQLLKYVNNSSLQPTDSKAVDMTPSVKPNNEEQIESDVSEYEADDDNSADDEDVSKFAKVESYLKKSYDIRFNTVSRELEIRKKGKTDFTHLDDFEFNDLLRAISRKNIKISDKTLAVSLFSSFTPRYNPFQSYMDSLPKWKETDKDHISHLASFIKAKDQYWFKVQFKKALVRTVACAIGKLPFNKHCLVFHGKQNDGKSTVIRFLVPSALIAYIKENFKVDKDGLISLCQNFIINLDEIDTMNKGDLDQIKALFATDSVKERLPYARTPAKFKRTASFFGSTNKNEFLTDETGNVRWLIIEIDSIDFNYSKEVDIDAVWAQAYALLKSGFEYQMTKDEVQESEQKNQKFKRVYVELEYLQKWYEPCNEDHQGAKFMQPSAMLNRITSETSLKLNTQLFAKALSELGFEKVSKRQKRENGTTVPLNGYFVLEKNNLENRLLH